MIDPTYLAQIRRQYRAELVIALVQLEQLAPMWWPSQIEMAKQLGTERRTITEALARLAADGLIRKVVIGKNGGTWIWWVKRSADDAPNLNAEPAWTIRDTEQQKTIRLPIRRRWEWAEQQGIPKSTMQSFLNGYQLTLRGRWRVVGNPWDA
jgi:DNA-binding transcriptional regulator YhcF (GntR family)